MDRHHSPKRRFLPCGVAPFSAFDSPSCVCDTQGHWEDDSMHSGTWICRCGSPRSGAASGCGEGTPPGIPVEGTPGRPRPPIAIASAPWAHTRADLPSLIQAARYIPPWPCILRDRIRMGISAAQPDARVPVSPCSHRACSAIPMPSHTGMPMQGMPMHTRVYG